MTGGIADMAPAGGCHVLVCGAGSAGRRHAANLRRLGARVTMWRERPELLSDLRADLGDIETVGDLEQGVRLADAVVVATATDRHMPICLAAARTGRAIYVEKPLSHTLDGIGSLRALAGARPLVVEVGCQLRMHPCLIHLAKRLRGNTDGAVYTFRAVVGQRLDHWRPGADYRASYSAAGRRGGGALFDLIHEIDLVQWLLEGISSVAADLRHVGALDFPADDLANLILETEAGAAGAVQLDMLSPVYRRSLEIVCADAILEFDYVSGTLTRYSPKGRQILHAVPDGFERNDMFIALMAHFLKRVADPTIPPCCSLEDGIGALRVALAARQASAIGCRVILEDHAAPEISGP